MLFRDISIFNNINESTSICLFTPRMMVNPNYEKINVESQLNDKDSILNFYKEIIRLKSNNMTLILGDTIEVDYNDNRILAYMRSYEEHKISVVCNLRATEMEFKTT